MLYFPNHLNIETSDLCNRSCRYCPVQRDRDTSPARLLDLDVYERLLRELQDAPGPLKISLQWIDEPLTNPRFFDYAALGRELLPRASWLVQSNGDLLTAEHAERLKALFDGVVVNFYAESAWRAFERRQIDVVTARRPDLLQSPGRLERPAGAKDRSGEAVFHFNHKWHDEDWVWEHDQPVQPPEMPCHRLWTQAAIGYDGVVYVCCRDNLKSHPVGDLHAMSLLEAYNSPAAMLLRRRMEAGRRDRIFMCHTCEGEFVERFFVLTPEQGAALAPHRLGAGPTTAEAALALRPADDVDESGGAAPTPARASLAIVEHPRPPSTEPAVFSPQQMPWGLYDYRTARRLARALGHVALPGFLPRRYEVVVGLTGGAYRALVDAVVGDLGPALKGLWVCGSRVMTRPQLLLVDPTVFECESPLAVGRKDRLRERGPDVDHSSDLDLKVLVADDQIPARELERRGQRLGSLLEDLVPHVPVSGHHRPLVRLLRVPASTPDARAAFAAYNAARLTELGKGPLSLEYTQLLFDPQTPRDEVAADATAPVRERLVEKDTLETVALAGLDVAAGLRAAGLDPEDRGALLRATWDGLTGHQLVCALEDFPQLAPRGVRVEGGRVLEGALAVWAACQAGRSILGGRAGRTSTSPAA